MVCMCRPLQSPSLLHLPLGGNMFISRHDMRLTYTYCDPRVQFLIGYDPSELLGRTVYQFHNPVDAHKCSECHSTLIKTGTGVSPYYRYLGKTGVWVWMQTKATIVSNTRGQPQYVVCNNYIISEKEGKHSQMMELQQQVQTRGQQGLVTGDLLAKGALDLHSLTQVTSPVSSTDGEHEQHDDTGYNSAVSSMGSANTSPCPLLGGVGVGSNQDLDPSHLATSKELSLHCEPHKDKSSMELEVSLVQGLETATELGFHSTLSSAIYGEEFGVQDLDSLADAGVAENMANSFDLNPLPSVSDQHSDPFLCNTGSGRGRGEGSLTHVMEDMEVLDTLLQDIGRECDNSPDSVFPTSPLSESHPQGNTGSDAEAVSAVSMSSIKSLVTDSLPAAEPLSDRTLSDTAHKQSFVLSAGVSGVRPPSLLRTLLDKEDEAAKGCPPVIEQWTKSFPAVTLSSDKAISSVASSHSGQTASTGKDLNPKERSGGAKQQSAVKVGMGQQLMMYDGKQILIPRQVDLTFDHSDEEGEELRSCSDNAGVQSPLPDDLMDFAMQYCDSLTSKDSLLSDNLTAIDTDVWTSVDDLMPTDTSDSPCSPSPPAEDKSEKDIPNKSVSSISGKNTNHPVSQEVYSDKQSELAVAGKTLTQPAGQPQGPLISPHDIQCNTVTSTRQDLKPAIILVKPAGGVRGVKTQPVTKDKMAAMLKLCTSSSAGRIKCCSLTSPALSDHKYSSTRTHSPGLSTQLPGGKRMRTQWDRSDVPFGSGSELTSIHNTESPTIPPKVSDPVDKVQVPVKQAMSPRIGGSLLHRALTQDSKPTTQPTSPPPAPIPVNGGGKPLTAMSELEKHLRGLVAPPDERSKDDILTPIEETSQSGSRPFLELLLTGEISHERYRQIDYHLLYQERERRLEENGQTS